MTLSAFQIPRRTACAFLLFFSGCIQDEEEPEKDPCAAVPIEQCDGLSTSPDGSTCVRWGGGLLDYERKCRGQAQELGCVSRPACELQPLGVAQDPNGKRWLVTFYACLPSGWKQLRNSQEVVQWPQCP